MDEQEWEWCFTVTLIVKGVTKSVATLRMQQALASIKGAEIHDYNALRGWALYVIVNQSAEEDARYWSNEHGWTARAGADVYNLLQRQEYRLPIGGEWLQINKRES